MLFFIIACTFFLVRTLTNKEYTKTFSSQSTNTLFNAVGLTVTCVISIMLGGVGKASPLLLTIAAIFGLVFAGTVYLMLICFAKGPLGMVNLIFNLCCIVPTLAGVLIFKESMNLIKILGMILFLSVVFLSWADGEAKGQEGKKKYIPAKVWMPVTILTMLMNGSLSMMQTMAVRWCPDESIIVFSFYAYLIGASALWIATILGVVTARVKAKKAGKTGEEYAKALAMAEVKTAPTRFWVLALVCGLLASGGNILIMYAVKTIPASVAYPLQSSSATVIMYLIGLFWYKEARTKLGIPMVLLGVASIVLLTIA